jgi:hypothetical protein
MYWRILGDASRLWWWRRAVKRVERGVCFDLYGDHAGISKPRVARDFGNILDDMSSKSRIKTIF